MKHPHRHLAELACSVLASSCAEPAYKLSLVTSCLLCVALPWKVCCISAGQRLHECAAVHDRGGMEAVFPEFKACC